MHLTTELDGIEQTRMKIVRIASELVTGIPSDLINDDTGLMVFWVEVIGIHWI